MSLLASKEAKVSLSVRKQFKVLLLVREDANVSLLVRENVNVSLLAGERDLVVGQKMWALAKYLSSIEAQGEP